MPSLDEEGQINFFPDNIPSRPFPPPAAFDGPPTKTKWQLSDGAASKLDAVIAGAEAPSTAPAVQSAVDRPSADQSAFGQWRDDVAVPVFSSIVERLRAADEWARVAVGEDARQQSVTLKLRLRAPTAWNPDYRSERSITARWDTQSQQIEVMISGQYGTEQRKGVPRFAAADLTGGRLEEIVMGVVDKLIAERAVS